MHELHALSRLALIRHRWVLMMLLVTVGIGLTIATLLLITATDRDDAEVATMALVFALLPAGLGGAILFDYANGGDIVSPASGCSHWLLRMPIESWKIAIIPVVLKSIWISAIWLIFAISLRTRFEVPIPLIVPCFLLSASAIWLMVIAWMPLRFGWHRLVLLVVLFMAMYLMLLLVVSPLEIEQFRWRAVATTAGAVLAPILYVTAVLAAIRVVGVARTAAAGIIPEVAGRSLRLSMEAADASVEQVYASPLRALAWNEFSKTKHFVLRSLLIGAVPGILIGGLLLPLHAATLVLVLMFFAYLAGISVCGNRETATATGSTLPSYLLTSPFTSAQIAWTRTTVWLVLVTSVFSGVVFVFLLWALWPSNRQIWMQWAADQTVLAGGGASELSIGLRLSAAGLLAAAIFAIGRMVGFWWIGMSGRNWFVVVMTIVASAVYLIPFALFLRWFIAQTQWSQVQAALQSLLDEAPLIMAALLILKSTAATAVAVAVVRTQLVTLGTIGRMVTGWMLLVLLLSTALTVLIPYPIATFLWCWGAIALAIPLARALVMPWMVDWNRHR